jgi:hypothetical protein
MKIAIISAAYYLLDQGDLTKTTTADFSHFVQEFVDTSSATRIFLSIEPYVNTFSFSRTPTTDPVFGYFWKILAASVHQEQKGPQ